MNRAKNTTNTMNVLEFLLAQSVEYQISFPQITLDVEADFCSLRSLDTQICKSLENHVIIIDFK